MDQAAEELSARWGIGPIAGELLAMALTHRSHAREHPEENRGSNERLEFLGDAVLGFLVADHLFRAFPGFSEGDLSRVKAVAVSEPLLHEAADAAGLGPRIRMSRAEEAAGGRERPSILSDVFEAVVAAIYLAQGIEGARRFVMGFLSERIAAIARHEREQDFKTVLQEAVQAKGRPTPTYRIISAMGPDHRKVFTAEARSGRRLLGRGTGYSKKEAEQAAAREALDRRARRGA
ncbi:MAG: ribonuclease III [Armatimonadetes bacterium]|nr:ribonuclease III [Armatimonadota bacterium]